MLQTLIANQFDGFHQGARGIAEQDPIDGMVDIGDEAGGIQKGAFQIQRFGQLELLLGLRARGAQELVNQVPQLRFLPPQVITVERAFAGHSHSVDLTDADEEL